MSSRSPPVVVLAVAWGLGCALRLSGVAVPVTLLLLLPLTLPVGLFLRPRRRLLVGALLLAAVGGWLRAAAWSGQRDRDCRWSVPDGPVAEVTGRFLGRPGEAAVPFRVEEGLAGGCRGEVRAYPGSGLDGSGRRRIRPGRRVRVEGVWRRLPPRRVADPSRSGYLVAERVRPLPERPLRGRVLRLRGAVQERLGRLFGPRAPVTEALVLARKERLDPGLREAFARAGVAHLLAISGFHVGIVAGLVLTAARLAGAGPRRSPALAAAAAWAYVGAIGSPDAAVRAATLLALLALGPVRGRPVVPLGALATAFLAFLLVEPGGLGRAGFQLSFAGTAGLILRARPYTEELLQRTGNRVPEPVAAGLAASLAATLPTLPLVAWHFGEVPLLGIPATLLLGPLVALAIPGIFLCLILDPLAPGAAGFVAGGVDLLLAATVEGAERTGSLPLAWVWVSRRAILSSLAALAVAALWFRVRRAPAPRVRRLVLVGSASAGLIVAPALPVPGAAGTVEIVALDVGQGDAFAVRSPRGRWVLVDAGPRSPGFDAGARRIVPYLRRRGVRRLEAVVLTHPHLDHIGGAPAVLASLDVGGVLDPGHATGSASFEEVLREALRRDVGWWPAADRRRLELDGMELRVVFSPPPEPGGIPVDDPNDLSVVILVRHGRFGALLTGDAPAAVERRMLHRIDGPVQLLKVGHHGSATSTSRLLVESLRPEVAVIPVGWRNRYGHPHPDVVERLNGAGTRVYRTDLHGTVVVRGRKDGSWSARLADR